MSEGQCVTPSSGGVEAVLGWALDDTSDLVTCGVKGLRNHTAILARSGSGKSFFLGRLMEEILLCHPGRVFLVDPNGDFGCFDEVNRGAWGSDGRRPKLWTSSATPGERDERDYFINAWSSVRQRHLLLGSATRPGGRCGRVQVGLQWRDAEGRLTPLLNRLPVLLDDTALLNAAKEFARSMDRDVRVRGDKRTLADVWAAHLGRASQKGDVTNDPEQRKRWLSLLPDLPFLGWPIWFDGSATSARTSIVDAATAQTEVPSVTVLNTEATAAANGAGGGEALLATLAALEGLWAYASECRKAAQQSGCEQRVPTFVVIDEAHRFAPNAPLTSLGREVRERIMMIVSEGRKYELYLVVATQSASQLDAELVGGCQNGCLLCPRPGDAPGSWDVPAVPLQRGQRFGKGDGVLIGDWAVDRRLFHAAPRRTMEGGANLVVEEPA